ncbi:MAG: S8 family serine peptidase [Spirosomataceae bacterium]
MANILPLTLYIYNSRLVCRLLLICLSVGSLCVYGQTQPIHLPNKSWNSYFIQHLQNRYSSNRIKALRLAKKQHWAIDKKYAKNRYLSLQGIDSFGIPIYYSTHNIAASTATHTIELYKGGGLGIDLKGDLPQLEGRLCIWDGGMPRLSHVEFGNRIRQKDNNTLLSDHSTHLSGTIAAAGINPQVKGMAFGAKLDVWDYTDDLVEMAQEASKVLVSNHAYGPVSGWIFNESRPGNDPKLKWEWWGNTSINAIEDYRFGFYDEKAQDLDNLAYNNPFYLIVKSADNKHAETGPPIGTPYFLRNTNQISILERSRNDGYDVIPAEANAKNILTIGGADIKTQNGQLNDFSVASFSGWGPTDDGRIKPDLLGIEPISFRQ